MLLQKKELEELIKKKYASTGMEDKHIEFSTMLTYLCKMYWMQRFDKLQKADLDLLLKLTNYFGYNNKEDDFVNGSIKNEVISFKTSYKKVEEDIFKFSCETLKNSSKKKFNWLTKLFK